MKSFSPSLLLLASVAPLVSGHYVFSKFLVDGSVSQDFEYIRRNSNGYMPTLAGDILSNDFRCNQGSMDSAASTKVYTVAPGTEIGFGLAYGASMKHPGPLQVYMSKAPGDVKEYDGSGDWFKVYQEGVCSDISDGLVDTDWCTWGKDTVKFNIPNDMPPGQYLVRVEHIGLHRGFSGNSEFYFTCAQIEVTGSGTGTPAEVAKIPGIYQPDDANIHFNIYYPTPTAYDLPGPSVWVEGKGGSAAQSTASEAPAVTSAVEAPAESKTTAAPAQTTSATACKPAASATTAAAQPSAPAPSAVESAAPEATTAEAPAATSAVKVPTESETTAAPAPTTLATACKPAKTAAAQPSAPAPSAVESTVPEAPAVTSAVEAPAESKTTAAPAQTTSATACKPAASGGAIHAPGAIKKYFQCGGMHWKGSGACESGTSCKQWNPYYHQCV
ncbi:fungal cellulose binding domain protein [Aspergillus terreus]|uniref:AA9 family lytic polysaccharide monooxygenase n=1 Tax=Aspergillus terreus TaxID=33178 RepID=A0A5M3Z0C0_ASPTE|nr:hypothetical protein ATETN484_0007015000 [Aspergillus terreus]GFF15955.1 fungal cellulose binding domain protein [Aspergillus terreus]